MLCIIHYIIWERKTHIYSEIFHKIVVEARFKSINLYKLIYDWTHNKIISDIIDCKSVLVVISLSNL